ncbi:MAG: hypothetical protein KDI75_04380 [Xanthomonadales bacterium]|nr:hypothetical protein [Xanthomonadales bacterium]
MVESGVTLALQVSITTARAIVRAMKNHVRCKFGYIAHLVVLAALLFNSQPANARELDESLASDVGQAASSKTHTFQELGLRLPIPSGFMVADTFDGFGQPDSRSAIVLLRFPGAPISRVARDITRKAFAVRDMKLNSRKSLTISGKSALLFSVNQNVRDLPFAKWILVIGDDSETRTLTASYPLTDEAAATRLSASLKQSLLATQWIDIKDERSAEARGYAVASSTLLKMAAGPGRTLIMTSDGKLPTADANSPLLVFARSLPGNHVNDATAFASQRLNNFQGTQISKVRSRHHSLVDGIETIELVADAVDVATGSSLRVFQYLRVLDDEYFIVQGRVGAGVDEDVMEEFSHLARSVVLD